MVCENKVGKVKKKLRKRNNLAIEIHPTGKYIIITQGMKALLVVITATATQIDYLV